MKVYVDKVPALNVSTDPDRQIVLKSSGAPSRREWEYILEAFMNGWVIEIAFPEVPNE